jgi:alkylation response protein AidB-like acyl-CoA dehydrogenase
VTSLQTERPVTGPYAADAVATALWPRTHDLLAEGALDTIASRAAAADERGVLEASTLDLLRDAGYFGLPVPAEHGGGGAGLLACAAVQRRLAMADPALAIGVNMHLFSVGMAVEHWRRHQDACGLILGAIASQGRIVASAFAEPGLGGSLLRSNAEALRADGGYVVTGVKTPCSLAAHCDLVCFQMQAGDRLLLALLPASAEGVRVERSWDALGMRASGSDTLLLERCFVPDDLVFHDSAPGDESDVVFAAGLVWFCATATATYLGLAARALAEARGALRRSRVTYADRSRADLQSVHAQLGEVVADLLTVEAACVALATRLDGAEHDPRSLLPLAVAIKHAAVRACTRAVEEPAELVGGLAYARTGTLARLWRDVQAARFHPPTRPVSRQALGRWALELPFSLELDSSS